MARWFIVGFAVLVSLVGVYAAVEPNGLEAFARSFLTGTGLWIAAGLRLTLGVVLWIAAPASRAPLVLRVLGALFVASGLALPVVGLDRMMGIVDWGAGLDDLAVQGAGLLAVGLGAFLLWSVSSTPSELTGRSGA